MTTATIDPTDLLRQAGQEPAKPVARGEVGDQRLQPRLMLAHGKELETPRQEERYGKRLAPQFRHGTF